MLRVPRLRAEIHQKAKITLLGVLRTVLLAFVLALYLVDAKSTWVLIRCLALGVLYALTIALVTSDW